MSSVEVRSEVDRMFVELPMAYDAVVLVLRAIERQGSIDPSAIRDGLAATTDFIGAMGAVRYLSGPDPERSVVISRISRISGGRSYLYRIIDPAGPEP